MKETVMQGKPYAGNPHVRFDEGAGAPRHSGRSALLYRALISFLAFSCALGAGAAEYFVAADGRDARITGRDTVKVWADGAANPTAVRYNWGMQGFGNLYNAAGIPASCFTTEP